jgi:branched-chain amino acid transport system substrate-binding protein
MRRPWLVTLALVGGVGLVAAACARAPAPTTPAPGATSPQAVDTSICDTDPFGCVTYGPGEPIRIGTLLAISGDVAFLGTDSQHGAELAIDFLDGALDGTKGQLLGHDVELVNEDDGCSAEGGQAGATRLAADETILAVIGTTCSSAALGVADRILSEKGMLLISPSNTNPNLTAEGTHQPFYLRTAHNDKIQGAIVAHFAVKELQAKTAATIHDESPYADALAAVFRENFTAQGGTITPNGDQAIQSTDTDFKPLLETIGQDRPDVLYYPDFNPACALIAKQAQDVAGLADTHLMGSDGCLDPSYLETGGDAVNGTYVSGPDLSGFQQGDFYKNQFLPAYREQFGTEPTAAFHAHAFDAMNILFEAIKKVALQLPDGTLMIPRDELRKAIFATSGFQGLTGEITCNPLGDCATDVTIAIYRVPDIPVKGGNPDAKPVYKETLSLQELEG